MRRVREFRAFGKGDIRQEVSPTLFSPQRSDQFFFPVARRLLRHPDCGNQEYWNYRFIEPLRQHFQWEIFGLDSGIPPRRPNPYHNSTFSATVGWLLTQFTPKVTVETTPLDLFLARWLTGCFVAYGWNRERTPQQNANAAIRGLAVFYGKAVPIAPEYRQGTLKAAFDAASAAIAESACVDDGYSIRLFSAPAGNPVSEELRDALFLVPAVLGGDSSLTAFLEETNQSVTPEISARYRERLTPESLRTEAARRLFAELQRDATSDMEAEYRGPTREGADDR